MRLMRLRSSADPTQQLYLSAQAGGYVVAAKAIIVGNVYIVSAIDPGIDASKSNVLAVGREQRVTHTRWGVTGSYVSVSFLL